MRKSLQPCSNISIGRFFPKNLLRIRNLRKSPGKMDNKAQVKSSYATLRNSGCNGKNFNFF